MLIRRSGKSEATAKMPNHRDPEELRTHRLQTQLFEPSHYEFCCSGTSGRTRAAISESGHFADVGHEVIRRRRGVNRKSG